jgi:N-acyl-D-amino-acid deacylase
MRFLLSFLFLSFINKTDINPDIIIRNGKIIDGTGNSWYYADIAIKDGKIVKIGKLKNLRAEKEIDATGLIIAPGFIDVHTHIEGDEVMNPQAANFIYDGVTSVVTGNCGSSKVDLKKYFGIIDSLKLSINVASLVGHNDVRRTVMGRANKLATAEEMASMKALIAQAMKDGAVGFSTGLQYIPGAYANFDEVVELGKAAAEYDGVYASHIRDEGDSVIQAIDEAIRVGREANMPVEISHFKVGGQQNWGRSAETLKRVADARKQGIDVTIDQYPYTASSTSLSIMLPDWVLSDGQDSLKARLTTPALRKQVKDHLLHNLNKRKLLHFDYAMVAYYAPDTTLNGKSIEQINLLKRRPRTSVYEAETIVEMMEKGGAGMVFHGMSEEDVKNIMRYPYNMFASDASIRIFNQGAPHPRGYGTNARVLAKYVREENVISLEEAIRRMTSLPANKFKLKDRGLLKEGYAADIVVFSDKEVKDLSTFEKPHQYSQGFKYVLVNGKLVVNESKHTGARNGKILLGPGAI